MDSTEFSEWVAFDSIEPIGGQRADLRTAMLASTFVNVWKGKGQAPARLKDFLLFHEKPKQSTDEMITLAKDLASRGLGRISRGNDSKSSS